jgi:hypothetical protein
MLKMYILILNDVPLGTAVNSACHAAVACTLRFQNTPEVKEWLAGPFRKVTCQVNDKQLKKAIEVEGDYVEITELNLDGRLVGVAFKPRSEYHKHFKFLTLFGKGYTNEVK